MKRKEPPYQVEYHLHKDKTWVCDMFDTNEKLQNRLVELRKDGYKPSKITIPQT